MGVHGNLQNHEFSVNICGWFCFPAGIWSQEARIHHRYLYMQSVGRSTAAAMVHSGQPFMTEWKKRRKNYSCRFCGKDFVLQQDRDGHMNAVHLKTKPYKCESCLVRFANKRYLVEHKKRNCTPETEIKIWDMLWQTTGTLMMNLI